MIKKFLVLYFSALCIHGAAQEKSLHYIGGMYYGVGFHHFTTTMTSQDVRVNNIGGRLAFGVSKYIRVGIMGGNTFKHYDSQSSFYKIGHGGLTAEIFVKRNKWNTAVGLYMGGGKYRNLYVLSNTNTLIAGDYINEGFMFVVPFLTANYSLSQKLSLACMIDYFDSALFTAPTNNHGLNLKVGILFSR